MTAAAPVPAKTDRTLTSYRVLKFPELVKQPIVATGGSVSGSSGTQAVQVGLKEAGTYDAATAKAAVRAASDKHGAGTYVAVPASSWKPQKVTVTETTVVTVGDA